MTPLDQLKEIIQKANPDDIGWMLGTGLTQSGDITNWMPRPIRLADVLYVYKKKNELDEYEKYTTVVVLEMAKIVREWNCLHDDLSLQSPETIQYLLNILK